MKSLPFVLTYTEQLRVDLAIDLAAGPRRAQFAAEKQARLSSREVEAADRAEVDRIRCARRTNRDDHRAGDVRIKALSLGASRESLPASAIAAERAEQAALDKQVERLDRELQTALRKWEKSRLLRADVEYREAASRLLPLAARYLAAKGVCGEEYVLGLDLAVSPDQFHRAKVELAAELRGEPA